MHRTVLGVLAALTVAVAGVYAIFVRDLIRARARLVGRSTMTEASFGTLEYAVLGEGEPVLSVHGAGGGFDQALHMTGALASHGYRIIAPSRFGYLGSSLPSNPTTAMQADAYAKLLNHLGLERVVVVGISAGAWSSIQFAIRHPNRCRALMLLVPADYLPAGTSIHGGAVVRAIINSDFVAWAALKLMPLMPGGMTRMILGTDAAIVRTAEPNEKARVQGVLQHLLPVSSRFGGMTFDIGTAAAYEPYAIEKISCPVLAISAQDDRFGTADRAKYIAASVRDGRTIIFPTGGHALVGHSDIVLHEIALFLDTHPDGPPPKVGAKSCE